jgi:hypothetical protein
MEIKKNMDFIWDNIIKKIDNRTVEIQTKKLNGEMGVWFSVNVFNDSIIIGKSIINSPSSKLKNQRIISKNEFLNVYQYYSNWKNNEIKRTFLKNLSQNTSYIFAIIHFYDK